VTTVDANTFVISRIQRYLLQFVVVVGLTSSTVLRCL
jgi:hypothetical protein